ncbi:MAG: hypothetical protein K2O18_13315 [Oscillospiraceae bacterium]|nr:hypothetical protein [Oscillospiraceae bacterium]
MERKARCISAATLLHDNMRRKLQDYLRPMANDDDLVWQQMTFERFTWLIRDSLLYMKAYGEYSDYDEMKLRDFSKQHLTDKVLKEGTKEAANTKLQEAYNEFEKRLFISCWYSSPDLSDVVFKIYARGNSGIAIGTKVGTLRKQLCEGQEKYNLDTENKNKIRNIVCANVQYVPQKNMWDEELFEPAQVYAPVFLKGLQFKMDNEFRVCVEKELPEDLIYNSEDNQDKTKELLLVKAEQLKIIRTGTNVADLMKQIETEYEKFDQKLCHDTPPNNIRIPVRLSSLIEYIAIKNDSWFQKLGVSGIKDFFEFWFNMKMTEDEEYRDSGFLVFKLDEIGVSNHV